jgi:hypothetical protein
MGCPAGVQDLSWKNQTKVWIPMESKIYLGRTKLKFGRPPKYLSDKLYKAIALYSVTIYSERPNFS